MIKTYSKIKIPKSLEIKPFEDSLLEAPSRFELEDKGFADLNCKILWGAILNGFRLYTLAWYYISITIKSRLFKIVYDVFGVASSVF